MLNARRHRSGNYSAGDFGAAGKIAEIVCSTPEGIGAGITRARRRRRSTACSSAQRPKASERELLQTNLCAGAYGARAQRPKASERELQASPIARGEHIEVLNARRPRSGNYFTGQGFDSTGHEVLNARRHRSGNYPAALWPRPIRFIGAQRPKASERELPDSGAPASPTSSPGAQRPKASERELLPRRRQAGRAPAVLNARRHRSGNYQYECGKPSDGSRAQRPKASERELPHLRNRLRSPHRAVLNARRHRSGNYCRVPHPDQVEACATGAQRPKASERELPSIIASSCSRLRWCSTPEGIGAGITGRKRAYQAARRKSAQRPKASERELHDARPCVAPRRVYGAQRPKASERELLLQSTQCHRSHGVLNARRHRSGNYATVTFASCSAGRCSTPEGIGAGITAAPRPSRGPRACAQRPKASERELLVTWLSSVSTPGAQRPKASERELLAARRRIADGGLECSAPEGIGAGITSPRWLQSTIGVF